MSNFPKYQLEELELEAKYVPEVLKCFFHTIIFHRALDFQKPFVVSSPLIHPISFASVADLSSEYVDRWSSIDQYRRKVLQRAATFATRGNTRGGDHVDNRSGRKRAQFEIMSRVNESISHFVGGVLKNVPGVDSGTAANNNISGTSESEPMNSPPQRHQIDISFLDVGHVKRFFWEKEEKVECERWSIVLTIKNPHEISRLYDLESGATVLTSAPKPSGDSSDQAHQSGTAKDQVQLGDGPIGDVEHAPRELVENVEKRLKMITWQAHEKTDHLPAVTEEKLSLGPGCFPFEISFPSLGESSSSFAGLLKFLAR